MHLKEKYLLHIYRILFSLRLDLRRQSYTKDRIELVCLVVHRIHRLVHWMVHFSSSV